MSIVFKTTVQPSGRRFTIPKNVRDHLGIDGGDSLFLTIKSQGKTVLFRGRQSLKSGPEIYGGKISSALTPGSTIWVEASRPKADRAKRAGRSKRTRSDSLPGEKPARQYWIVSPNVMDNPNTVKEWRNASFVCECAFMGYGPSEDKHKGIGRKFAQDINPGDVILIARRDRHNPDVVGFGVAAGSFKTSFRGYKPPDKSLWHGSLRRLSPFHPWPQLPNSLDVMRVLGHTAALRKLIPERSAAEKTVCQWLEANLNSALASGRNGTPGFAGPRRLRLTRLPHDHDSQFQVRSRRQVRLAIKREAELVHDYDQWIRAQQRVLTVANYKGLKCDAYEQQRNNLIEAKSSRRREHIRMAVGQLLDYANLGEPQINNPNLAILLPERPGTEVETWLKEKLEISVIWRQGNAFLDNANRQFT